MYRGVLGHTPQDDPAVMIWRGGAQKTWTKRYWTHTRKANGGVLGHRWPQRLVLTESTVLGALLPTGQRRLLLVVGCLHATQDQPGSE